MNYLLKPFCLLLGHNFICIITKDVTDTAATTVVNNYSRYMDITKLKIDSIHRADLVCMRCDKYDFRILTLTDRKD